MACCCAKPSIKGLTLDFDAKYDVEHVLGVGNYAVVRYCRRRSDGARMRPATTDGGCGARRSAGRPGCDQASPWP